MENLGLLLLVIAIFIANIPALIHQWRTDRAGFIKSLWMLGAYFLYIALGLALMLLLIKMKEPRDIHALTLTGFIAGWILYGGLILLRVVPRYREVPRWLTEFGVLDVLFLALIVGCFAAYLLI